jgi:hypothetical protein
MLPVERFAEHTVRVVLGGEVVQPEKFPHAKLGELHVNNNAHAAPH